MNIRKFLIAALMIPALTHADVVLDGSTGGIGGESVDPGNGYTYDITQDLGTRRGVNLFHSFAEFDIAQSEHANFSGDAAINNVIARISSGLESSIDGRVSSSIESASLWLINPAGFVFGNGAVVDVNGVFHTSTGDFVSFSDGARFYADLSEDSSMTSAPINQFGFMGGAAQGNVSFVSDPTSSSNEALTSSQNLNVNSDFIAINSTDIYAREINIEGGDVTVANTLAVPPYASAAGPYLSVRARYLATALCLQWPMDAAESVGKVELDDVNRVLRERIAPERIRWFGLRPVKPSSRRRL